MPVRRRGTFTPIVVMMPVTWRRWFRFVINPMPAALITVMVIPPARFTPAATIPIIPTWIAITDMQ
jgi:hypothetical protein